MYLLVVTYVSRLFSMLFVFICTLFLVLVVELARLEKKLVEF